MRDRLFLQLNDRWAWGDDQLQWLLMKADKGGLKANLSIPRARWRAVSFIGSTKRILQRCLREKRVGPTPEAKTALDTLPDTFKKWLSEYEAPRKMEAAE